MQHCKSCEESLLLQSDYEEDGPIPDDVHLGCGCHFHWQCLMDEAQSVSNTYQCPSCSTRLAAPDRASSASDSSDARIYVQYTNEGGLQVDLDIMPSLKEEAYIQNHPGVVPSRALHVMCAEGDVDGLLELLLNVDGNTSEMGSIIRYQDPLESMISGLHLAVKNKQESVIWLLLWLSSTLPVDAFPEESRGIADSIGLGRLDVTLAQDIRSLKDDAGRTAGELARQMGGPPLRVVETGLLHI